MWLIFFPNISDENHVIIAVYCIDAIVRYNWHSMIPKILRDMGSHFLMIKYIITINVIDSFIEQFKMKEFDCYLVITISFKLVKKVEFQPHHK